MPANPKLSSEVHPGKKKIVLVVYGSDFYYVNYNLQLCILRNLLLTGRFPPTNLSDSKIIDWIKRI